jgi:hypothetical protein
VNTLASADSSLKYETLVVSKWFLHQGAQQVNWLAVNESSAALRAFCVPVTTASEQPHRASHVMQLQLPCTLAGLEYVTAVGLGCN